LESVDYAGNFFIVAEAARDLDQATAYLILALGWALS
jgi:hypothetical protein